MELTFATPALLFPAVSLLFLSYADLVRRLHDQWQAHGTAAGSPAGTGPPRETLGMQIRNLRRRIFLIRNMQALGEYLRAGARASAW